MMVQENGSDGSMDQGIEIINIVSSGSTNTMSNFTAEDVKSIVVTGDKNLTIGALNNAAGSLNTFNAGALTGNLTLTVSNGIMTSTPDGQTQGNVALAVTSGTGADSIRVSEQIGTNDTIATGEGADTLRLQSNGGLNTDTIARNTAGDNVTGVKRFSCGIQV